MNRVASNRPLPLLRCLPSPLLTISSSDIKRHVTIYTKGYKIRVLFVLAFFILFSLALSFFLLHFDAVVCLSVCLCRLAELLCFWSAFQVQKPKYNIHTLMFFSWMGCCCRRRNESILSVANVALLYIIQNSNFRDLLKKLKLSERA